MSDMSIVGILSQIESILAANMRKASIKTFGEVTEDSILALCEFGDADYLEDFAAFRQAEDMLATALELANDGLIGPEKIPQALNFALDAGKRLFRSFLRTLSALSQVQEVYRDWLRSARRA